MYIHHIELNFPKSTPLPPSQGGHWGVKPQPENPKIQYLRIIWENNCCDSIFQPIFKKYSFLERTKLSQALENLILFYLVFLILKIWGIMAIEVKKYISLA